ncbi:MAG: aldose 1-epimerase [Chloroflexia bacterium]|nr:aldose 1-epimerase [Chloroflexia bacterium]
MGESTACRVSEITLDCGVRAVRLENDLIAVSVLPDKGADIYQLIYKPFDLDVLWKSPWGLPRLTGIHSPAADSQAAWMDAYEGGWQEILPSGGGPSHYRGAELIFHGEASMSVWETTIEQETADAVEVTCSLRLRRSPLSVRRVMRIEANRSVLTLTERITNLGGEPLDVMWGHHPAYGAPFLSGDVRIDTNARSLRADDLIDPPHNPFNLDARTAWPAAERDGTRTDLSHVPDEATPRGTMAYLHDFSGDWGWYGLTNTRLGVGVGLVWPASVFPYAWFWQELHASPGYPWHQEVYVMAIEPFSSIPGHGLAKVMEKTGSQLVLAPGESRDVELRAVLFESSTGLLGIEPDGTARPRQSATDG